VPTKPFWRRSKNDNDEDEFTADPEQWRARQVAADAARVRRNRWSVSTDSRRHSVGSYRSGRGSVGSRFSHRSSVGSRFSHRSSVGSRFSHRSSVGGRSAGRKISATRGAVGHGADRMPPIAKRLDKMLKNELRTDAGERMVILGCLRKKTLLGNKRRTLVLTNQRLLYIDLEKSPAVLKRQFQCSRVAIQRHSGQREGFVVTTPQGSLKFRIAGADNAAGMVDALAARYKCKTGTTTDAWVAAFRENCTAKEA